MFCKNCGKEIRDGAKFCASCGAEVVYANSQSAGAYTDNAGAGSQSAGANAYTAGAGSQSAGANTYTAGTNSTVNNSSPSYEKNTNRSFRQMLASIDKKLEVVVVMVVVVVIIVSIVRSNSPVNTVKNGALQDYPKKTVGTAFDGFFSDTNWKSYKENGNKYVQFTGDCMLGSETVEAKVVFRLNGDEFYLESMRVGPYKCTASDIDDMLDKIYNNK